MQTTIGGFNSHTLFQLMNSKPIVVTYKLTRYSDYHFGNAVVNDLYKEGTAICSRFVAKLGIGLPKLIEVSVSAHKIGKKSVPLFFILKPDNTIRYGFKTDRQRGRI